MLCGDLEGWDGDEGLGGRLQREETHVYLQLIHIAGQKKLTTL